MSNDRPIGEDDLQAFVDGRLDGARRAALDAWLAKNPQAAQAVATEQDHRALLRARLADKIGEPVPPRLRIAAIKAGVRQRRVALWRPAIAAVVLLAAGGLAGWTVRGILTARASPVIAVGDEGFAAYRTFVSEVAHPVEVGAAQEAHLSQWLSKRLGHPLMAPNLAAFGYTLMGGRLLPAGTGTGAQFMYEDRAGSRLTLYVRTGESDATAFRFRREGDIATFSWIDDGLGFALTASKDREQLLPVAEAVYRQIDLPAPARAP